MFHGFSISKQLKLHGIIDPQVNHTACAVAHGLLVSSNGMDVDNICQ